MGDVRTRIISGEGETGLECRQEMIALENEPHTAVVIVVLGQITDDLEINSGICVGLSPLVPCGLVVYFPAKSVGRLFP